MLWAQRGTGQQVGSCHTERMIDWTIQLAGPACLSVCPSICLFIVLNANDDNRFKTKPVTEHEQAWIVVFFNKIACWSFLN